MYDAMGIRRHAGLQAEVLNVVAAELLEGHPKAERKLKEVLGHTPRQVRAALRGCSSSGVVGRGCAACQLRAAWRGCSRCYCVVAAGCRTGKGRAASPLLTAGTPPTSSSCAAGVCRPAAGHPCGPPLPCGTLLSCHVSAAAVVPSSSRRLEGRTAAPCWRRAGTAALLVRLLPHPAPARPLLPGLLLGYSAPLPSHPHLPIPCFFHPHLLPSHVPAVHATLGRFVFAPTTTAGTLAPRIPRPTRQCAPPIPCGMPRRLRRSQCRRDRDEQCNRWRRGRGRMQIDGCKGTDRWQ